MPSLLSDGHVDWLSVTFNLDLANFLITPSRLAQVAYAEKGPAPHGYRLMRVSDFGLTILSGGTPQQGIHVVYPGECLRAVRAMGVTDRDLLMHAQEFQGRLTRLDVAVDILYGTTKAEHLEREWRKRRVLTRARGATRLKQLLTDEDTLYIGSRASERFFRAYNKGAQEKMDYNWLRLELECKKLMAQAVGNAIAEHDDTRVVINRAIRDYVEFPRLDELNAALQQADVEIPRPSRKIHSTYRWLMETVAPAIARYQFEHPGEDIESSFVTLWRHHLAELRKRAAQGNV